jgi:hypothetical protein
VLGEVVIKPRLYDFYSVAGYLQPLKTLKSGMPLSHNVPVIQILTYARIGLILFTSEPFNRKYLPSSWSKADDLGNYLDERWSRSTRYCGPSGPRGFLRIPKWRGEAMENETETPVAVRGPRRPSPRRKTRGLMQDKRGRWWIDYYTPAGQRRRKLYGTHAAAKTALEKIDLAKTDGTYTDPHASPNFKEFSENYLATVSIHNKSHDRVTRLMKNLVEFFGESKLSKIERERVIQYRIARLKTVSKATVNREVSLLRHMFNVAIDLKIVALNPARGGIGMKAFKEQERERYLEMSEVDSLLTAIQARIVKNSSDKLKASARKSWQYLHTAVVMALHTGMRKGEILGLKWEHVN